MGIVVGIFWVASGENSWVCCCNTFGTLDTVTVVLTQGTVQKSHTAPGSTCVRQAVQVYQ